MKKLLKGICLSSIVSIMFMVLCYQYTNAQEIERNIKHLYLHLGVGTTTDFKSLDSGLLANYMEGSVGYFVAPCAFAYGRFEGGFKLSEINGNNTFYRYQSIGAGLGWRFLRSSEDGSLDLKSDYSLSFGNKDWKANEFGVGVYWKLPSCKLGGISMGLGYRFYHSKSAGIKSAGGVSATVGFSF